MEDVPGVCTRLQTKRMTRSGTSLNQSSEYTQMLSAKKDRVSPVTRQSLHSKDVNAKCVDDAMPNEKSEVTTDKNGGPTTSCETSPRKKSVRASPLKSDKNNMSESIPETCRGRKDGQQNKLSASSDENYVTSSYSTPSRSTSRLKRSKLSLTEKRRETRSTSVKNPSSPQRTEKLSSESSDLRKSSSERIKTRSSLRIRGYDKIPLAGKRKASYVSESEGDVCKVSPRKKKATSISKSASAENLAPRMDKLEMQGDTNINTGPSKVENKSYEAVNANSECDVSDDSNIALGGDGGEASSKSTAQSLSSNTVLTRHRKSLILPVKPTSESHSNRSDSFQEITTHKGISKPFTEEKADVGASQRLSPVPRNTVSERSTPLKRTRLAEVHACEESSDDTFEELPEKIPEESEMTLNTEREKLAVPENLGNEDRSNSSSNQEVVFLDDMSNDGNPAVESNNTCTSPRRSTAREIIATGEGKLCENNEEPEIHSSVEDEASGIQSPSTFEKDSQLRITDDARNSSPGKMSSTSSKCVAHEHVEASASVPTDDRFDDTTSTAQNSTPKSPNKSVSSAWRASSGKGLVVECNELVGLDSSDECELTACVPSGNDEQVEEGKKTEQKKNDESIGLDGVDSDASPCDEGVRQLNGSKTVVGESGKVTNFITLDSDESSEFSVTEVEDQQVKPSKQAETDENLDDEIIEVRGVIDSSEDESTDDGVKEIEDDDIEIIEMDVINKGKTTVKRLENKGMEEQPANRGDVISLLQRKITSGEILSSYKERFAQNKMLVKNPVYSKIPNNLCSENSLSADNFVTLDNKSSLHDQNEDHSGRKDSKTSPVSSTTQINSISGMQKSNNIDSKHILSSNLSSGTKSKEYSEKHSNTNIPQQLSKELKKQSVIAASKVLEANLDVSSSDVEEIVVTNATSKTLKKSSKELKSYCKSFLSSSRNVPENVSVTSQTRGKHLPFRAGSKNSGENLESDSDAESRKKICQKAKMRIAECVAESTGSNSKHATSEDDKDLASRPGNLKSLASHRSVLESQVLMDSIQQQKGLSKMQRRKRLAMLKQQKEEKLNRLKEHMASKEDASCSSSESSAEEREKRDVTSHVRDGFIVSSVNKVTKEERKSSVFHHVKRKKRKINKPSVEVANPQQLQCRATTQWIVEDISKGNSKLRRLPKTVLDRLDDRQQKLLPHNVTKSAKGGKKRAKRKLWKDTGVSVDGFRVATDTDFIPLETGATVQFGVMSLNKMAKAVPALAKMSANFRHSMLYGSRVQREPAKTVLDRQLKLKAANKDGFVRFTRV